MEPPDLNVKLDEEEEEEEEEEEDTNLHHPAIVDDTINYQPSLDDIELRLKRFTETQESHQQALPPIRERMKGVIEAECTPVVAPPKKK
ncbi:hypothetical protein N0V91_007661 [Didymella pomorum]|uniref:Uncharacterized protein n=1 Tax=Didymella pomorum TaxID=749634 RepID=A0A9W9D5E4_9PLEO|nr:hypothetical protein N0V91_007661 [Didymella pomorum]